MSRRFNKDTIDQFHDYGLHTPTRTVYIGSEGSDENGECGVDHMLAERVIKNLLILDTISDEPITIILNNLGGDVFHGMSIYTAIKNCRSHIIIKATGYVMSMASVIFQAGDERLLSEFAVVMLHHGYDSQTGHVKTVRSWVDFGKKYDVLLNRIYLKKIREKNPDFKKQKLDQLLDFDTLLLPEEAIELGLADGTYGEIEKEESK